MRVAINSVAVAGFVFAVVIGSNCGDPAPAPVAPTIRTFDVTTTFDSFSYETSAPSLPDCPPEPPGFPPYPYCTHYRAYSGATLTGTFTTADTFPALPTSGSFSAKGSFSGQFCDAIDNASATGCVHVGPTG